MKAYRSKEPFGQARPLRMSWNNERERPLCGAKRETRLLGSGSLLRASDSLMARRFSLLWRLGNSVGK